MLKRRSLLLVQYVRSCCLVVSLLAAFLCSSYCLHFTATSKHAGTNADGGEEGWLNRVRRGPLASRLRPFRDWLSLHPTFKLNMVRPRSFLRRASSNTYLVGEEEEKRRKEQEWEGLRDFHSLRQPLPSFTKPSVLTRMLSRR